MTARLLGQRVYLDANVFIYAFESHGPFSSIAGRILETVCANPTTAFTSELTLAEVLVVPFRQQNSAALELYERFLTDTTKISLVGVSRSVLRKEAELRAQDGPKLPDAIHVSCALEAGCSIMVTQDRRLKHPQSLNVIALSEFTDDPTTEVNS